MIKKLLVLFFIFLILGFSHGQDIPLFSQKLTNSFIYNPSFAGISHGSLTFSHRSNYSAVQGAPENNLISLHTPFANNRFGMGLNIFQENVNILKNSYASGAFAYHIIFNKFTKLSFGVSGEYNTIQLNGTDLNFMEAKRDFILENLKNGKNNTMDFSFGSSFSTRYIKIGLAANRLATAWLRLDSAKLLSNYYSSYLQGSIPVRGNEDIIEPYVAYRKFSETNNTYDVGLFYTYEKKLTAGTAFRKGGVFNFTIAYHLSRYLMVGYSREMIVGGIGGFIGSSNEFTMRLDFNDQSYKQKFKQDYKSSLAYRRKTVDNSTVRKSIGGKTPKQLSKAQKRVAAYSPNKRFQNITKLSHGRKVTAGRQISPKSKKSSFAGRKKSYNKKKPIKRKK